MQVLKCAFRMLAFAMLLAFWGAGALAQSYPNRTVRIIVPYAPGGLNDTLCRAVAERLAVALPQGQFVVENRPGGNYVVATDYVAKQPGDGYTLLLAGDGAMSANVFLYSKLPYDPQKDFVPVAMLVLYSPILIVSATLPVNNVAEFISYAKANPGKLNYFSVGSGSPPHMNFEVFKKRAGIDVVHLPFKGGAPGILALLGGQVHASIIGIASPLPHVRAGKVKVLAYTGTKRLPLLKDVPTMEEAGFPGFKQITWEGLMAPAGTPREVAQLLNTEINKILRQPEWVEKQVTSRGLEAAPMTIQQFADFLPVNREEMRILVQESGAKLD